MDQSSVLAALWPVSKVHVEMKGEQLNKLQARGSAFIAGNC